MSTTGRRFPRDFLIAELRRVGWLLGRIPSMEDFDGDSQIAAVTVAKRFGGWKQALASAGFDPSKARYTHCDLDLLEELRRVATLLGRSPTTTEFDEHSTMGATTIS